MLAAVTSTACRRREPPCSGRRHGTAVEDAWASLVPRSKIAQAPPSPDTCRVPIAEPRDTTSWSRVSWQALAQRADQVIERCGRLGVRVHRSSRFTEYYSTLGAIAARHPRVPSARDLSLCHQAVCEVGDLAAILDSVERTHEPGPWLRKLAIAVNGPPLIEDEKASIARDIQFELMIASLAEAGGLDVHLAEPDLVIEQGGQRIGIAAKRITSEAQVPKRLREATKQITRSGESGLISLDLSLLAHPREGFLLTEAPADAIGKMTGDADRLCVESRRTVLESGEEVARGVLAIVVHVACIYRTADSTTLGVARRWSIGDMPSRDPRSGALTAIYRALQAAVVR